MLGSEALARAKDGVRIVNVARGPLIDEVALAVALKEGRVHSVALEVFETEPLPAASALRSFGDRALFGSHNASNTVDAVRRTSLKAIDLMTDFLSQNTKS